MEIDTYKMTKKGKAAADEKLRMKKAATRVNVSQPLHTLKPVSERATMRVKGASEYTPRERAPTEATGPVDDLWQRGIYSTGDGDTPLVIRPGSLDFKKWPSKGLST